MIKHITYHILNKEQNGEATLDINPNEFIPNDAHQKFLDELTKSYTGKAGKGFGSFDTDEDSFPMPKLLRDYQNDGDFQNLTVRMMNILLSKVQNLAFATGGKVFISHYEEQSCEYMLIAILTDQRGFSAQNWQMIESEMLDITHLRYAGRIDLTAWQTGGLRYISFLKGQGEVSIYFKEFLSCNDALVAKEETKKLVKLLDEFATEQGYDFDQRTEFLREAKTYLTEISNNNEPFVTETFANRMYPEEPQILKAKLSNVETGIEDGFIPDKTSMKKLSTYTGKTKHWRLSFDRTAISEGNITSEGGRIIINNPTAELLEAFTQ